MNQAADKAARDWGAEAAYAAEHAHTELFEAHRGAFLWEPGVVAVFGNDGYDTGTWIDGEVREARERLRRLGARELAFGLDVSRYTWVILVEAPDAGYRTAAGRRFRDELLPGAYAKLVWDSFYAAPDLRRGEEADSHEAC
jgi:hypothetical protein